MRRSLILMYHIVAEPRSEREARYCCPPERFAAQMRHLRASGTPLVSLDDIAAALETRTEPPDGVAVTFDDGFVDTFRNAMPILVRHGIPATMFAVAHRTGASNDWMACRGFPERSLMGAADLRAMRAAGVTIGSHTCTHPRLPDIGAQRQSDEIRGSKAVLEDLLGEPVLHLAYPFGLFDESSVHAAQEAGYRTACTTRSGFNGAGIDAFRLRRIEVFGADRMWQFRQKLKFGANEASVLHPVRYYGRRLAARLGM